MKTLVLDIEGTLITNAVSIFPRPDLYKFLEFVKEKFDRIVVMTCLEERKFREVANILCNEGSAPKWFEQLEYINWKNHSGQIQQYKKLRFINKNIDNIWIIDDMERYISPDEISQWIEIESFVNPYRKDKEFKRIMKMI